jgi:hypothetical protein
MNIALAVLIVVLVTGLAVTVMLVVRRRAPDGGYFNDGDRASGVFGVLATGFSVLLGFLIFLAFESYDQSRVGAEEEAVTVAQQVETALRLPPAVREDLVAELVCYARFVIDDEWSRMEDGTLGDTINPWGVALFQTLDGVDLTTPTEESAYDTWFGQIEVREVARQHRIHGASGVIPTPLWIALFAITAVIFAYMLCFADSGEGARIQALLMGSVTAAITVMLLVLAFLNQPFHSDVGGVKPEAMERTLDIIDQALAATGQTVTFPCDEAGRPV